MQIFSLDKIVKIFFFFWDLIYMYQLHHIQLLINCFLYICTYLLRKFHSGVQFRHLKYFQDDLPIKPVFHLHYFSYDKFIFFLIKENNYTDCVFPKNKFIFILTNSIHYSFTYFV